MPAAPHRGGDDDGASGSRIEGAEETVLVLVVEALLSPVAGGRESDRSALLPTYTRDVEVTTIFRKLKAKPHLLRWW